MNHWLRRQQKACYRLALAAGADIVIMIHPDYQYTPQLIPSIASLVASGLYRACSLRASWATARSAVECLSEVYFNRFLTLVQNFLLGAKLSEYHTGYRAFARDLLERLPLEKNSDDFVFDNEILAQVLWLDFPIGDVTCPANYMPEASSINFRRSPCVAASAVCAPLWNFAGQKFAESRTPLPQTHRTTDA